MKTLKTIMLRILGSLALMLGMLLALSSFMFMHPLLALGVMVLYVVVANVLWWSLFVDTSIALTGRRR